MSIAGGCHQALLSAAKLRLRNRPIVHKELEPVECQGFLGRRRSAVSGCTGRELAPFPLWLTIPTSSTWLHPMSSFMNAPSTLSYRNAKSRTTRTRLPGDASRRSRRQRGRRRSRTRCLQRWTKPTAAVQDFAFRFLLETTAGQGSCLGWRFEHLARILEGVRETNRLGVCLDTCHVFAAGYELAPRGPLSSHDEGIRSSIGLERLRACHLNDSLKPLGSRVDRHAHVGQGQLGIEPFQLLVNDRRLRDLPMVLETPKEETPEGHTDARNLRTLRELVGKGAKTSRAPKNRWRFSQVSLRASSSNRIPQVIVPTGR